MYFNFDFTSDAINEFNSGLRFGYDDSKELEKTDGRDVARENAVEKVVDSIKYLLDGEWRNGPKLERENAENFGGVLGDLAGALYYLHGDTENEDEVCDASRKMKESIQKYLNWYIGL